ncbi:hypothetical protein [Candidatus Shikimatogenerans silvanidophilus]|uniref:hypothetical protein n=1 Tax=Candidatus Shikimatogenerans silvanidophilus TaxID=2782547 RepID=UPI001BA5CED2|nr:hypothetical protein [Candidatus Shikimatogenerans silvanidophilus]
MNNNCDNNFYIGEKISILDKSINGIIKNFINNNLVTIINDFGFEEIYPIKKIVKNIDIKNYFKNNYKYKNEYKYKDNDNLKKKSLLIIDLHYKNIPKIYIKIKSNIVEKQIYFAKKIIEKFFFKKNIKLILIHGNGKGILKKKLFNLLNNYKYKYNYNLKYYKYNNASIKIE